MTQLVSVGGTGATGQSCETLTFEISPDGMKLLAAYLSGLVKNGIRYRFLDQDNAIEVVISKH